MNTRKHGPKHKYIKQFFQSLNRVLSSKCPVENAMCLHNNLMSLIFVYHTKSLPYSIKKITK